jgi:hypothetical protein
MLKYFIFSLLFVQSAIAGNEWKITKNKWSSADEKSYQQFVVSLGNAVASGKCHNVRDCFVSEANPYHSSDPSELNLYSDCADFPYFVRGYFSWKNNLPFSFAQGMSLKNPNEKKKSSGWKFWKRFTPIDIRYSLSGNIVSERFNVIEKTEPIKATSIFNDRLSISISSGNYRTDIDHPNTGSLFADFYPIKISRESIVPGTVIYDPNGHVTLVYKITDDGRIYYVDAHPDNGLTTGVFNSKFMRSNPGQGSGFKAFRPIELVNYKENEDGSLVGGKIISIPNEKLPLFSKEQFLGNADSRNIDWQKAKFIYKDHEVNYYEWVRLTMSLGDLKFNPVKELEVMLIDLCDSIKNRVESVNISIKKGLQNKSHPSKLPVNIYGSDGDWENYSTPSRDAILKTTFKDTFEITKNLITRYQAKDPQVVYDGQDLISDLITTYDDKSRACQISYTKSDSEIVNLNLEDVRQRLYKLSFDPYHCIELRWGATSNSELKSCADNENKYEWYRKEQRLRNQSDRKYDLRMDFSLGDLSKNVEGSGVDQAPDTDLFSYLIKNLK